MKEVKHQTRIITESKYSSKAIGIYGFYDLGKTIVITFIDMRL